ncbi:MAG TPA: hypothetical protein VNI60_09090, partial [Pyrinomonadaceae bacterium]|nr:hypothetical protein [Pyrinomonadaceae bacterium]
GENMTKINQPLEEYLKSEHAKKQWEIGEIDSELCNICNEPMPQNTLTLLFGTHYKCFQNESVQRKQETPND